MTTRHLLHGLLTQSWTSAFFAELGIPIGLAWGATHRIKACEQAIGVPKSTMTPEARAVIERTYQLAADLGDRCISGEHLLLALVREPQGSDTGRALAQLGISWERAGQTLMALQKHRLCPPQGVWIRGLRVRRYRKKVRGLAGRAKRLVQRLYRPQTPFASFEPARKRTLDNPYPFYKKLRCQPIYWDDLVNQWVVTGYSDAVAAMAEPRLSQRIYAAWACSEAPIPPSIQQEFRWLQGQLDRQMLFLDAPEQPQQRARVAQKFTPKVIAQMREQMQTVLDEILEAVAPEGCMEVVAELAVPFPLLVIVRMLGLPVCDLARFKRWSSDYFTFLTSDTTLVQDLATYRSVGEASAYFRSLLPERRRNPQSDLISLLLQTDTQDEELPEEEVIANCMMLLATGHENTTRLIGSGLFALLRRPDQWQRLRDDPGLIGSAVEEFLRFDSPVQWLLRYVSKDFAWRGHQLKQGQRVQIGLGAANRDPSQFPEPDRLDITRSQGRHVAFGHGSHFCLGAALARMEAQIVFTTLTARFPRLRLERPPQFLQEGLAFRGLESLHVRWD